jgi:hypothetical protein
MRVRLARRYRAWMWLLLPLTLGLGTAALWVHSLEWPLIIDSEALTLRSRRKLSWNKIRKITTHRDYVDDRILQLDIQTAGSQWRIPMRELEDGQTVAVTIVSAFRQSRRRAKSKVWSDAARDFSPTIQPVHPKQPLTHTDPRSRAEREITKSAVSGNAQTRH